MEWARQAEEGQREPAARAAETGRDGQQTAVTRERVGFHSEFLFCGAGLAV